MKKVSLELLKKCANNLMFDMEDEEETPLSTQEVLLNAKDVAAGQIKLPKVVG